MRERTPEVVVVGSANLDFVVEVDAIPLPGETVKGGDLRLIPGGKGANQAVASARLGRRTAFIGRVGDDQAGSTLRAALESAGVMTAGLLTTEGAPSGVALIAVAADGDNAIVVSPGANGRISAADIIEVEQKTGWLGAASAVMLQLEVPLEAVEAAAFHASGIVVLNPAPAPGTPLPATLLEQVDVLVPNQTELVKLAGQSIPGNGNGHSGTNTEANTAVRLARGLPSKAVVVTMGADGAVAVSAAGAVHMPAPAVDAVDTTAAGDAFCAALTDALITGGGTDNDHWAAGLADAARWAVRVGAATTTRAGAQPSLPTASEVEQLLNPARPQ